MYGQTSNSTLTLLEQEMSRIASRKLPPKHTAAHPISVVNAARPMSAKSQRLTQKAAGLVKPKPRPMERIHSTSNLSRTHQSLQESDTSTATRSFSALGRNHSSSRFADMSSSIREATGATRRYNQPESLFGLHPAELFGLDEQHQPRILDRRASVHLTDQAGAKRDTQHKPSHRWQKDMSKIIDLYNVHHTPNYRKTAVPPTTSATRTSNQNDTDSVPTGRQRRGSFSKAPSGVSKSSASSKPSTLASLNTSYRNSVSRPSIKVSNA